MAVYKRYYKSYEGHLTSEWVRWLVPARYALQQLFASRLVIGYSVACYIFPIVAGAAIYLRFNASAMSVIGVPVENMMAIDAQFFAVFLSVQAFFSFLMTAYAAPGLIGPDLSNNALPLYLCRPISKAEYVLGKMAVLLIPLSLITWIPGCLLWLMHAGLEGGDWGGNNLHLLNGMFWGSLLWIVFLSILGLALSAWVRWKIMASALLFGIFFISGALSAIVNEVLDTKYGYLLNPGHLIAVIWAKLLVVPPKRTLLGEMFNVRMSNDIPQWAAWAAILSIIAFCIWVLNQKLRGREVVS
jgi:ABC-2 type transport system permease protein